MSHVSDNDSIMADFCDGTHFKSHSLLNIDQPTLHLHLYYDEPELCNPLGSKRTKHNIGNCQQFCCK